MNNTGQSRLEVLICYRGDYAPLVFVSKTLHNNYNNERSLRL